MKNSILYLFLGMILGSCQKQADNIIVNVSQSGSLTIQVMNENGNAGAKGLVSVYSSSPSGQIIYNDSTDNYGFCYIGKVIQGQYSYYVSTTSNNKEYNEGEYFQVIADETKTFTVNPFLNIGTAKVKIVNTAGNPISNVNVALLPYINYNSSYAFNDYLAFAYFMDATNNDGWVTFEKVPASSPYGREYRVLVYYDSNSWDIPYSYFYIHKNEVQSVTVEVEL